jgi:tetratricopeptide (TPR) repeat protein
MASSAVKIKAFLGKIKEDIIDCDDTKVTGSTLYNALVLLEIVQRGVIPTSSYQDEASKVVDAIRSAAGKTLLDSSSLLPKPLLAGSSAMSGMVAEKFAAKIAKQKADMNLSQQLASAMTRCQDVQDSRLIVLLQILTDDSQEAQRKRLLTLSEGYFLRAASFQPDPPQMWKRTMDVILARSGDILHPLHAAYPISQLIRIAKSKNNSKRVAELTLRLVECLLSSPVDDAKAVSDVFVSPYRPIPQKDVREAQVSLEKCDLSVLDSDGVLHYRILDCRILLEFEESLVHDLAQQQLTASKNRGILTSLESSIVNARRDIWLSKINDDDPLENSVSHLRDHLLKKIRESSNMVAYASEILTKCVVRLQEICRVIGLEALKPNSSLSQSQTKSFYDALYFSVQQVLLATFESQSIVTDEDTISLHIVEFLKQVHTSVAVMLEVCALSMSFSLWMKSSVDFDGIQLSFLKLNCNLLCALSEKSSIDNIALSNKDGSKNSIKESIGGNQSKQITLHYAILSLKAFIRLSEGSPPIQEQTDKALEITTLTEENTSAAARFGTIFFLLLDTWSGFQQTPWCHCTVAQARTLIKIARSSLSKAATDFGRKTSHFEAIVLDLAEADAESGILGSGLNKIARTIYQRCLSQASTLQITNHVHIVKSHCLLGLSRLALIELTESSENTTSLDPELEAAESYATSSLWETNQMILPEATSFCMISLNTFEAIRKFHRSFSRQLTAEAMLRSGKPSEAESLLLAAMEDTPNDFDAILAMSIFRMRVAFFSVNTPNPAAVKAAQLQLLKLAKLYPNKAPPFALLGYWFEENGDVNRAVGCYSKALQHQPSHPVAGRGIIRLKDFVDAHTLLGNAVARKSYLNGWAWKALGIHHAMVKDDSESAVICFQEALRCKDIVSSHDLMNSFYAPSSMCDDKIPEASTVWCELAACYVRLGRQTAAIRAFKSAWSLSGERMNPSSRILWAQVQLQLGQHEEAISTYTLTRKECDETLLPILSYGLGCALFSASKIELIQGKAHRALQTLMNAVSVVSEAIAEIEDSDSTFICSLKLMGDIFTFGAAFPARVFSEECDFVNLNRCEATSSQLSQLAFIARGESFYSRAEKIAEKIETEEYIFIRSSLACDCGVNLLHQAQKIYQRGQLSRANEYCSNFIMQCSEEARLAFNNAAGTFRRSILLNPLHAPAW